jgi:acetoin utilization deacetylase AcuC-like enzyme
VGVGDAAGYTVNLPVAAGSGDAVYTSLVEHVAVPLTRAYEPQLVLMSAGYDAHRDDPLAGCTVTETGFAAMTSSMRRVCTELEVPLGGVLEGGYELGALARSVAVTLEVLGGVAAPAATVDAPAVAPEAVEARGRLEEWWPGLA